MSVFHKEGKVKSKEIILNYRTIYKNGYLAICVVYGHYNPQLYS